DEFAHLLRVRLQPLDPLAFGHVTGDLGEATQSALWIVQRGDQHVGPEPAAVLAHAPAFVLETAVALCTLQLQLGPAHANGLLRIEAREVMADDLRGAVALDAFGAGVPAAHDAAGIEHEDGVIDHALDHQPEQVVANSWKDAVRVVPWGAPTLSLGLRC